MKYKTELYRKRREHLKELFEELSRNNSPILVEGKRDRKALIMGGLNDKRIIMHHGKSRLQVEEKLQHYDEIILLLDYDKEGTKLNNHFKQVFRRIGIKVNLRYWKKIYEIFDGHIDCIENLRRYFKP